MQCFGVPTKEALNLTQTFEIHRGIRGISNAAVFILSENHVAKTFNKQATHTHDIVSVSYVKTAFELASSIVNAVSRISKKHGK